ncbi:MAG: L-aspartate oxidase [Candidatus Eisenbacteria bacterium]|nr:L-aspartate oxidase [Candidatus Eisenbacteria bacterium]
MNTGGRESVDFVVIGSGIAGLTFALTVANHGRVLVVTKKDDAESATNMAQGGIAAVFQGADSFERHIEDTLAAGVGLCRREAVEIAVRSGPEAVRRLMSWGARFSTERSPGGDDHLSLGREGGHSARRIVHAADMTGKEIETALLSAVEDTPGIEILEDHIAIDLVVAESGSARACGGVHVLDVDGGAVRTIDAPIVVCATGGCGKVYLYTTNPDIACGDGIAMAHRAGVPVRNMEFIQFHPTCLYHPDVKSFLISEAVRGEGAVLRDLRGSPIMRGRDPRGDLAPRDVVARAIDKTMKESGDKHVNLDLTGLDPDRVRSRFPNINARLLELDIDMTREPVPVVPAAHYACGGVAVDLEGRTDLRGLYAVGEVAHTGMHGANRLASNSLLEAVVFSERAAASAIAELEERRGTVRADRAAEWAGNSAGPVPEGVLIDHSWDIVRRIMWDYVGIVRTERRLELANRRLRAIHAEVADYVARYPVSRDVIELRNISLVGQLIIASALTRKESRGLHWIEDYPERDDEHFLHDTVIVGGSTK